jgi:hypothetical protein
MPSQSSSRPLPHCSGGGQQSDHCPLPSSAPSSWHSRWPREPQVVVQASSAWGVQGGVGLPPAHAVSPCPALPSGSRPSARRGASELSPTDASSSSAEKRTMQPAAHPTARHNAIHGRREPHDPGLHPCLIPSPAHCPTRSDRGPRSRGGLFWGTAPFPFFTFFERRQIRLADSVARPEFVPFREGCPSGVCINAWRNNPWDALVLVLFRNLHAPWSTSPLAPPSV